MPKKRSVASLVGNFSPVKRRRAIFVSRMRHFRGDTGDVLNTRAVDSSQPNWSEYNGDDDGAPSGGLTLLEDRGAVDLDDGVLVFVLLVVSHGADEDAPSAERHKQAGRAVYYYSRW
jgi:hypothetical protein